MYAHIRNVHIYIRQSTHDGTGGGGGKGARHSTDCGVYRYERTGRTDWTDWLAGWLDGWTSLRLGRHGSALPLLLSLSPLCPSLSLSLCLSAK